MGRLGMDDKQLRDEMLAAFLAIEEHDAHVVARREFKRGEIAPLVRQSVAEQRARFHTTGEPESIALTPHKQVRNRMVPDPSMTDAEFLHQKAVEMDRANSARSKPNLSGSNANASSSAATTARTASASTAP